MKIVFKGCGSREEGEGAPLDYFIAFKRKAIPFSSLKLGY